MPGGSTPHGARHLIVDSTGLKLFGQGEWNEERLGCARRSWRKLHLAIDADTGEIVANVLTDNGADGAGAVPGLLEQVEGEIASFIADGAYDGEPVFASQYINTMSARLGSVDAAVRFYSGGGYGLADLGHA